MTRRIVLVLAGLALAVGLGGCAFDNGQGGTTVVPSPDPAVGYVPCITATGCDLDGVHYPQGGLVPNPKVSCDKTVTDPTTGLERVQCYWTS